MAAVLGLTTGSPTEENEVLAFWGMDPSIPKKVTCDVQLGENELP